LEQEKPPFPLSLTGEDPSLHQTGLVFSTSEEIFLLPPLEGNLLYQTFVIFIGRDVRVSVLIGVRSEAVMELS
jgi:hypothetical protein